MFDFSDKVVVVTGGSRGIGRRIAERFYETGAMVAICSRKPTDIEDALREMGNESGRIFGAACDTSSKTDLTLFLSRVVDNYGRIDIMINNAGTQLPQPTTNVSEQDFDTVIDTNLKGYFFASQFAGKDMLSRKAKGCIVNIGSVNAVTVVVGQAMYAATKAAISQMTKSMAREWGQYGIRVNCVGPGSIPTSLTAAIYEDREVERAMIEKIPLGRRGKTDEIADTTLYLASDFASYITGQTLFVDGGLTLSHG
jgi:NAD(P)-dependent dehydrogenase (short-subunit alcohol dehydrogenase family)